MEKNKNKIIHCIIVSIFATSLILTSCAKQNKEEAINTIELENESSNESSIENIETNPWKNIDTTIYTKKEYKNVTPILPVDLYEKIQNKETFVLYIGKVTCEWCGVVYPLIDNVNNQDMPIYYLNTSYFGDAYPKEENDLYIEVKSQHDAIKNLLKYSSVPNFRYIENGVITYGIRNPVPSNYFDEGVTISEKEELKTTTISNINVFFEDIKNGISIEKMKEWESFLMDLKLKNPNIEIDNIVSTSTTNEISKEELWDLEKEYGIRLAPTGEESYWDTVEELPPNE